jgi:hypothetical protein
MPIWQRPQYLMERLPQTLFAPDLQMTGLMCYNELCSVTPMALMEKFVPMFLNGLNRGDKQKKTAV